MDRSSAIDAFGMIDSSGAQTEKLTGEASKRTAQVDIQHLVEHAHLISFEQLILKDTAVVFYILCCHSQKVWGSPEGTAAIPVEMHLWDRAQWISKHMSQNSHSIQSQSFSCQQYWSTFLCCVDIICNLT